MVPVSYVTSLREDTTNLLWQFDGTCFPLDHIRSSCKLDRLCFAVLLIVFGHSWKNLLKAKIQRLRIEQKNFESRYFTDPNISDFCAQFSNMWQKKPYRWKEKSWTNEDHRNTSFYCSMRRSFYEAFVLLNTISFRLLWDFPCWRLSVNDCDHASRLGACYEIRQLALGYGVLHVGLYNRQKK